MRVLKWLFQPAYLLLIIVLVALYVNRETVFPEEVVASLESEVLMDKVDNLIDRLQEQSNELWAGVKEDDTRSDIASQGEGVIASSATEAPSDDSSVVNQVDTLQADQQPAPTLDEPSQSIAEGLQHDSLPAPTPLDVAEPETEDASTDVVTAVASSEVVASAIAEQLETSSVADTAIVEEAPVEANTTSTDTLISPKVVVPPQLVEPVQPLTIWKAARAAVWQGDLNGAVVFYRQLIAVQPANYDAYGEMGNVLLAQSDMTGAVDAYVTAARLIRRSGNNEMALRLASVVARMDEEKGRALFSEFSPY